MVYFQSQISFVLVTLCFFQDLSVDREGYRFCPFINQLYRQNWNTSNGETSFDQEYQEIFHKVWHSYLCHYDLHFGGMFDHLNRKPDLEPYAPKLFAKQFGFCQLIPIPPLLYTINSPPHLCTWVSSPSNVVLVS